MHVFVTILHNHTITGLSHPLRHHWLVLRVILEDHLQASVVLLHTVVLPMPKCTRSAMASTLIIAMMHLYVPIFKLAHAPRTMVFGVLFTHGMSISVRNALIIVMEQTLVMQFLSSLVASRRAKARARVAKTRGRHDPFHRRSLI